MITVTADGFVPEEVELQLLGKGNTGKVSFQLVSKRRARVANSTEWETVWERVEFEAWGDAAEQFARQVQKGANLTVIGTQKTSSWTDAAGTKRRKVVYEVLRWDYLNSYRPESSQPAGSHTAGAPNHKRPVAPPPPAQRPDDQPSRTKPMSPVHSDRGDGQRTSGESRVNQPGPDHSAAFYAGDDLDDFPGIEGSAVRDGFF